MPLINLPGNISLICISRQPYSLGVMDQLEKKLQKNEKEVTQILLFRALRIETLCRNFIILQSYLDNILPLWGISVTLTISSRITGVKYK